MMRNNAHLLKRNETRRKFTAGFLCFNAFGLTSPDKSFMITLPKERD